MLQDDPLGYAKFIVELYKDGKAVYRGILRRAFDEMGSESITALLPPSRAHVKGMLRLGFQPDGHVQISGITFVRYRLLAQKVSFPTRHSSRRAEAPG